MQDGTRAVRVLAAAVLVLCTAVSARADETDNFTCRARPLQDAQDALDAWVRERIIEAVARANRRGAAACDAGCFARELQGRVGASVPHPVTWIPHARLARWAERRAPIERCRLAFRDSIYGARPYNQPWLVPVTGRIIFLADSIRLSGHVIGIDKLNHFIREGLAHWRDAERGGDIEVVLARELGSPGRPLLMNEHGLKGLSLTGVLAYADLAASYSGFGFWQDLLSLGRPTSFVAYDAAAGRYVVQRQFTFADHVTAAWDEGVNPSAFSPGLGREVAAALERHGVDPVDCRPLARLPQARLYVNPACLAGDVRGQSVKTVSVRR